MMRKSEAAWNPPCRTTAETPAEREQRLDPGRTTAETPAEREHRLYRQRRRDAIRRAERAADRFIDHCMSRGIPLFGEHIYEFYQRAKCDELDRLEKREAKRRRTTR